VVLPVSLLHNFEFCGVGFYRITRTQHFLIIPPAG